MHRCNEWLRFIHCRTKNKRVDLPLANFRTEFQHNKMPHTQVVPGEHEGLERYFAQSFDTRKLIVELCVELYEMNAEEQSMILGIARTYRKSKPVVERAPATRRGHLRLVA